MSQTREAMDTVNGVLPNKLSPQGLAPAGLYPVLLNWVQAATFYMLPQLAIAVVAPARLYSTNGVQQNTTQQNVLDLDFERK